MQDVLEAGEPLGRQLFAPIETGRAVVGQQFAGELAMDRIGKTLGLAEVGLARLPPQEVGVGRARTRMIEFERFPGVQIRACAKRVASASEYHNFAFVVSRFSNRSVKEFIFVKVDFVHCRRSHAW